MILVIVSGCKQEEECKSYTQQELKIICEINETKENYANPHYISFSLDYNQTTIMEYMQKHKCELKIETHWWMCDNPDDVISFNWYMNNTNES